MYQAHMAGSCVRVYERACLLIYPHVCSTILKADCTGGWGQALGHLLQHLIAADRMMEEIWPTSCHELCICFVMLFQMPPSVSNQRMSSKQDSRGLQEGARHAELLTLQILLKVSVFITVLFCLKRHSCGFLKWVNKSK